VQSFTILVALAILCLLALVFAGAVILWVRLNELQRRLDRLEGRAAPQQSPPIPVLPVMVPSPPVEPRRPEPQPQPPPPPLPPLVKPPMPSAVPRVRIEWEHWLGVRGAAVLGGIFLAVAGVLFFQYSIQHGLITKEMRVLLGVIVGTGAMVGGQFARRKGYELAGNAITGAGAVILYAAFWAAHALGVLPSLACFAAMALVTAISCWLSFRTGSQLIAWLGLTGGFATPLLVSTGSDRPIGLFAYVLVLDLGFLFVAGRKRWPQLGLWGLVGTFGIVALWILNRMDAHRERPIALVALGVFALLFVGASAVAAKSERGRWAISQAGAVLVPFLFALYFAGQGDVGYNLWPLALLGALLSGASVWLARAQGAALVPSGAAAGASAITLVWVLGRELDEARSWELVTCSLVLLLVFALGREWRRSRLVEAAARGLEDAWFVAVAGLAVGGFAACDHSNLVGPWPFVALFAGLAIALVRVASSQRLRWVSIAAAPLAVIGVLAWTGTHDQVLSTFEPHMLELVAAVLLAAVFAALAWFGREGARAGFLGIALGAWLGCLLSFLIADESTALPGLAARLVPLFFAAIGCFAATAAGSWIAILLSAFFCALSQAGMGEWEGWNDELSAGLISLAVLAAWLPLTKQRWSSNAGAWIAAAIIPLFWVLDVGNAIQHLQGSSGNAWIPVPFALVELAIGAWLVRGALWPLLVAIVCTSAILPLWMDRGVVVVWSALASAGAAWLWRGRNFTPALAVAVAGAAICTFASVLVDGQGSFERLGRVLLDAHAFEYLLPAVALLAAGVLLEKSPRIVCVVAGLLVALLWITVEVHQSFAPGERFSLFWPHDQAREVAVSVSWAVYALALLAIGMRRKQSGLRWASLVLLVIVIGKLFLFDLSELQGLYRVGSFLGLAVSLLLVSFGYQRFVFRKSKVA